MKADMELDMQKRSTWEFFPWENNICKLTRLSDLAGVVHGNDGDLLHLCFSDFGTIRTWF